MARNFQAVKPKFGPFKVRFTLTFYREGLLKSRPNMCLQTLRIEDRQDHTLTFFFRYWDTPTRKRDSTDALGTRIPFRLPVPLTEAEA